MSGLSPLQAGAVAASSKWLQLFPTDNLESIDVYGVSILLLAAVAVSIYYLGLLWVNGFSPESFRNSYAVTFSRAIWNIMGLFQVRDTPMQVASKC